MKNKVRISLVSLSTACLITGIAVANKTNSEPRDVHAAVRDGWVRVTSVDELLSGGTFILGYEATAYSNVIVPMRAEAGKNIINSGTTSGLSNSTTIDMNSSSVDLSSYEVTITASTVTSGAITISFNDKFIGNNRENNYATLFDIDSEKNNTAFKPTIGTDNVITLKNNHGSNHTLQYNTSSPRFACYAGTQKNPIAYKNSRILESLSLTSSPSKTTYHPNEEFDTTGMVVTGTFNSDPISEVIPNSDLVITPSVLINSTTSVTISHKLFPSVSLSLPISVIDGEITAIEVLTLPVKTTYYIGETLELKGLSLAIKWDIGDDTTYGPFEDNNSYSDIEIAPGIDEILTLTDDCVMLEYEGFYTEFDILVKDLEIFSKVTAQNQLVIGKKYLIASTVSDITYVMGSQNSNNRKSIQTTLDGGRISYDSEMSKLVLMPGPNGTYTLIDIANNGLLINAQSGTSNYLYSNGVPGSARGANITISEGNASIVFSGGSGRNTIRFNSNNNTKIFSCYASGQNAVSLYVSNEEEVQYGETFGQNFLDNIGVVCDLSGVTPLSSSDWSDIKDKYIKESIFERTMACYASEEQAGNKLNEALTAYRYIVNKYTNNNDYDDFLKLRTVSPVTSNSPNIKESSAIIIFVMITSSMTFASIYFFYRKKKQR